MRTVLQRVGSTRVLVAGAAVGEITRPGLLALVAAGLPDLRAWGLEVATGTFGADLEVSLVNDGQVTLVVDV